jgi:hypothetical protein
MRIVLLVGLSAMRMRMTSTLVWTLKLVEKSSVEPCVGTEYVWQVPSRSSAIGRTSGIQYSRKEKISSQIAQPKSLPLYLSFSPHRLAFMCLQVSRIAYLPYLSDVVVYNRQMLHFSPSITTVHLLRLPIIKPMNELQFTTLQ